MFESISCVSQKISSKSDDQGNVAVAPHSFLFPGFLLVSVKSFHRHKNCTLCSGAAVHRSDNLGNVFKVRK